MTLTTVAQLAGKTTACHYLSLDFRTAVHGGSNSQYVQCFALLMLRTVAEHAPTPIFNFNIKSSELNEVLMSGLLLYSHI